MASGIAAKVVTKVLQRYWRWSRGMTLGAQGCVIDGQGRVLLVRHGYRPGWHFPGGGVERGETIADALAKELREEAGVVLTGSAELFGVYANFAKFSGDHVAVFVVRAWQQPEVPKAGYEIAEVAFFAPDALPKDTADGTRRRIDEIFRGERKSDAW